MKITINDLTKLSSFRGAEAAAGRPYFGNRVTSVSVMDAPTCEEAVKENGVKDGLVLTTFRAQKDNETKVKTVRGLADSGVSGLCVFGEAGAGAGKAGAVDEEVIQEAEAKGLPLILMPGAALGYKAVLEQVMDKLMNGADREYDLINGTIPHLLDPGSHLDFAEALREAAIEGAFQVILFSLDLNPVLAIETRKRVTIAEAVQAARGASLGAAAGGDEKAGAPARRGAAGKKSGGGGDGAENGRGQAVKRIDVKGLATYWKRVTVAGGGYYLMIADNDDNYSEGEIAKLSDIIEIALEMWKYTPERDVRSEFVRALMRNNKGLAYTLRDELGIGPRSILSVFFAKGISEEDMADAIAEKEKEYGIEVIRLSQQKETNGIVVLTKDTDEKSLAGYRNACLELFDELKATGKSARIFHATGLSGTEGAGEAFSLIEEIWPYVETVFPYKRVFTKYEFAMVSNCVELMKTAGRQKKNYLDLLEPFRREVGGAKAGQLLLTLETFVLDAGMNVSKTGEILGVHTNTVQYRLKKINEILGSEITGNRVVPGLTIALALTRLEA